MFDPWSKRGERGATVVSEEPLQHVSPFSFPQGYELPLAASQGAPREVRFLLGDDLALFERGMNLELRIVMDSRAGRYRTHALAALLGLWSRSFSCRAGACALMVRGGYVSCLPLLRAACDCIGAQRGLAGGELDEFTAWLEAMGQSREHAALDIGLGRYRAGSMLAADSRLGALYRVATDLCMTHFGSTLLQVAPESDLRNISIAFADASFHLGWAELIAGWLLELVRGQLEAAVAAGSSFAVSAQVKDELTVLSQGVAEALGRPDRSWVEELGDGRYLFHNFRRQAGGAPRRLLL
jgi:hypothetical protein